MSSADQNKSGGKPGRRNRKAEQQRSQNLEPQQAAKEPIEAAAAPTDTSPIGAVAPADTPSIGFQTIATAYSDYTMKSLEEARCFAEKLSGVRSFDKALEIQSEFARQAYETYATDSRKIRELYSDLVMKAFTPSKSPPAAR